MRLRTGGPAALLLLSALIGCTANSPQQPVPTGTKVDVIDYGTSPWKGEWSFSARYSIHNPEYFKVKYTIRFSFSGPDYTTMKWVTRTVDAGKTVKGKVAVIWPKDADTGEVRVEEVLEAPI
ncbi:hypothetical protein [Streptomyces sp. NPDC006610]|uniref:hypothetical protein n=1 Tax=Streptomyces sp. NPDC006610 TaxID=3154584 RepID=UPI0033BCB3B8